MTHQSFVQAVAAYFRERPNQWIDGRNIAAVGGVYASRTRISNCRRQLGMIIENRVRTITLRGGETYRISEYRYTPSVIPDFHAEHLCPSCGVVKPCAAHEPTAVNYLIDFRLTSD